MPLASDQPEKKGGKERKQHLPKPVCEKMRSWGDAWQKEKVAMSGNNGKGDKKGGKIGKRVGIPLSLKRSPALKGIEKSKPLGRWEVSSNPRRKTDRRGAAPSKKALGGDGKRVRALLKSREGVGNLQASGSTVIPGEGGGGLREAERIGGRRGGLIPTGA